MKLTNEQIELVKGEVITYAEMNLGCDKEEAKVIAKDYLYDIVTDIEDTADWSNLNDDEVCLGDIDIAIGRCLANYEETDEDNYNMDELKKSIMPQKKIWMRLGVDVTADEETINKLLNGDDDSVLKELVKNGQFQLAGESYIPSISVEEYNEENGTNFEEEEVSFYY